MYGIRFLCNYCSNLFIRIDSMIDINQKHPLTDKKVDNSIIREYFDDIQADNELLTQSELENDILD